MGSGQLSAEPFGGEVAPLLSIADRLFDTHQGGSEKTTHPPNACRARHTAASVDGAIQYIPGKVSSRAGVAAPPSRDAKQAARHHARKLGYFLLGGRVVRWKSSRLHNPNVEPVAGVCIR
eukprot:scaffold288766_cov33-Tisochrysis_lutea.AAC.5